MMPFSIYPDGWLDQPLTFSEVFNDVDDFVDKVIEVGGMDDNLDQLYLILANKYVTAVTRYVNEEAFVLAIRRELQIEWPLYLQRKTIQDQIKNMTLEEIRLQMESIRDITAGSESDNSTHYSDEGSTNVQSESTLNNTGSDDSLNNIVNANNGPIANANTVPISNRSNIQTANKNNSESESIDNSNSLTGTENVSDTTGSASSNSESLENYRVLGNKLEAVLKQYDAINRDYLESLYRKVDGLFRVLI